jgi:nucleotide-binding universal stress UspA family protein
VYNTILLAVALQDWERYSDHAIALRDLGQSVALGGTKQMHVLSVYHYDEPPYGIGLSLEMVARAREDLIQRTDALMQQKLDEYVAPLKEAGINIIPYLEVGNPREMILRVAHDTGADVLLLGSHSKRGLLEVTLGGTARQISSQAPCPVVIVSPKVSRR